MEYQQKPQIKNRKTEKQEIDWKSYLDNFYQPIIISDKHGNHLYANDAALELTGYTREELLALGMKGLGDPERLNELAKYLKNRLNESPLPYSYDFKIVLKNGSKLDVRVNGHKIIWKNEPADLVAIYNITERKLEENWLGYKNKVNDNLKRIFSIDTCFNIICSLIEELRLFKRAFLTGFDTKGEVIYFGQNGINDAKNEYQYFKKRKTKKLIAAIEREEYRIGNSYFIPKGKFYGFFRQKKSDSDNIPNSKDLTLWQQSDILIVPLISEVSNKIGYLYVDEPFNGKRPDLKTVSRLEELLDIVSRRISEIRYQEMIFESEQKYRSITEQSVLPIAISQNKRYIYINQAFCDLFGFSREEILSWSENQDLRLIHADDVDTIHDADLKIGNKPGETSKLLIKGINKAGATIWLERFSKNINYHGSTSQLIILIDRTKEKEFENNLLDSESKSKVLLNASNDAVVLIDNSGKILNLNKSYAERFNKTKEELIGTIVWDLFPAEVFEKRKENVQKVIDSKKMVTMSDIRDGMVNSTRLFPVMGSNGEVVEVAVYARDITADIESALRLQQAEKLAAIGNLTAGIVHQIRNPLGNISFAAQLSLQQEDLSSVLREYLELILQDVDNANQVIQRLTEYNNPGEILLDKGDILIPLKRAISYVKSTSKSKKVEIVLNHPARLPQIKIADYWLEQIFINIINNSVQAITDKGKIEIRVYLQNKKSILIIEFTDNGCGIPKEFLSQVFDPFFTNRPGGVGLGLSLVNKIVELHNGIVLIDSKEEEFTRIELKFPVKKPLKRDLKLLSLPL
jgi:two-component system, sporulation sensor kinase A